MGIDSKVYIKSKNEFQDYKANKYFKSIYNSKINLEVSDDGFMEIPIDLGAFEVYFMNVLLYSKLATNIWPNLALLSKTCIKCYISYKNGENISKYKFKHEKATPPKESKSISRPQVLTLDSSQYHSNESKSALKMYSTINFKKVGLIPVYLEKAIPIISNKVPSHIVAPI